MTKHADTSDLLFHSSEWNFDTLYRTYDAIKEIALDDLGLPTQFRCQAPIEDNEPWILDWRWVDAGIKSRRQRGIAVFEA